MNNCSFLSDIINFNSENKVQNEQTFISNNNKYFSNNSITKETKFKIKEYQEKINENYVVRSATSKKWSIRFK